MSVYLINGPSGTGKTSIGNELKKRGYSVIDTDDEFGYYANLQTGLPVKFPGNSVNDKWYAVNGWIWDIQEVEKRFNENDGTLFFCGGSLNENIFYPRFEKIFRTIVDPKILRQRLQSRKDDQNTNNPYVIATMIKYLESAKSDGEKLGMAIIDTSSKSVSDSTDELLAIIEK